MPAIDNAVKGLNNLKVTYFSDSNIVSEISLMVIKLLSFNDQLRNISIVLDCVNEQEE